MDDEKVVLVTGATGFIGSALVEELEKGDYRVREASRTSDDISVDLTEPSEVEGLPDADIVINAAGDVDLNATEKEMKSVREINVNIVENLAERYSDTRFIHLSSLAAMGLEGDYIRGEEPDPVLPYSRSKLESEKVVDKRFEDGVNVRPGMVFSRETSTLLSFFTSLGFLPDNGKTTMAIELDSLTSLVVDIIESDIESPVLAAREYTVTELAEEMGEEGLKMPVPDIFVVTAGLAGEILRKAGMPVFGIVRARSVVSDQSISRQGKVDRLLEKSDQL